MSLIQAFYSFQKEREEKTKKLLVRIQITLDEEAKQIDIYEGDDLNQIVNEFALRNRLEEEGKKILFDELKAAVRDAIETNEREIEEEETQAKHVMWSEDVEELDQSNLSNVSAAVSL